MSFAPPISAALMMPSPDFLFWAREMHCCVVARAFIVACLDYI
jgi:hypothetical protein